MDSVMKVMCFRQEMEDLCYSHLLNVKFYVFGVPENGFDPRILTPEQVRSEANTPWTCVIRVRHADFCALDKRYDGLSGVIKDVNRGSANIVKIKRLRKLRRKEAQ